MKGFIQIAPFFYYFRIPLTLQVTHDLTAHPHWAPMVGRDSQEGIQTYPTPPHPRPSPPLALLKPWGYEALWKAYDSWTGCPSAARLASLRFYKGRVFQGCLCVSAWAQSVGWESQGGLSPCLFLKAPGSHLAWATHETPYPQVSSSLGKGCTSTFDKQQRIKP